MFDRSNTNQVSDKQVKVEARRTKKEEMLQRAGLIPKQKKTTAKDKRRDAKQKKGPSKSTSKGGFGEESRKATLGKLKGNNQFKSKSRYKRR
jgi:hypothetical protein